MALKHCVQWCQWDDRQDESEVGTWDGISVIAVTSA